MAAIAERRWVVAPVHWATRAAWFAFAVYFVYALSHLELTPARFLAGLDYGYKFLTKLFPPDFQRWELLLKGLKESLEIAILASVLGLIISLPVSLLAARNLMPTWVTWPARMVMVVCRSFHPVIIAILFVKAVGFGALAGILALTVASLGFLGKLFTEAIEEISLKQVEAVRATGAPFMSVIAFGVVYNSARVSLSERARELASLRVLGFTRGEISLILLGELALLTLLAMPLGTGIGYGLGQLIMLGFSNEIYRLTFTVKLSTIASAVRRILASSMNIWMNSLSSAMFGRMRLTARRRSKPSTPKALALNTSAMPPTLTRSRR